MAIYAERQADQRGRVAAVASGLGGAEGHPPTFSAALREALRASNDLLCGASITPMNRNLPEVSINYPACTRSLMSV
jgi:hypothetical protein